MVGKDELRIRRKVVITGKDSEVMALPRADEEPLGPLVQDGPE